MEESLILVDCNDQPIGTDYKLSVHRQGLLHRAFSIFVFDRRGRLMLQRRAEGKYHSANLWTNTCCGHPRPGETTEAAAARRLGEEMGFSCALQEVTTLIYQAQVPGDLTEHEFDHIFIGGFDGEPALNPNEASQWCWAEIAALEQWLHAEPEAFTAWFKVILADPACQLQSWRQQAWVTEEALRYQDEILPRVSRTFALTIPQLPAELAVAVTNAYLLCRMADTIEDEPGLSHSQKQHYQRAYLDTVMGTGQGGLFSDELSGHLTDQTLAAERELITHLPLVLAANRTLNPTQRDAIRDCLKVMTQGMLDFQGTGLNGLDSREDLDRYCYCVAGVVGEMLNELFIDFDPALAVHREKLRQLAVSFGKGLQLTNILKDQNEDRSRGVSWLPRDLLADHASHSQAVEELIATAHAHLRQALQYALLIPTRHTGIRRFMLWAIGLALLTLRRVRRSPGAAVKVSHAELRGVMHLTRLSQRSNLGLRLLYKMASHTLPLAPLQGTPAA